MPSDISPILQEVQRLAPGLHHAGTFSPAGLRAIARHAEAVPIQCSIETGSGASTLLLSHLSSDHTVFALDFGTGSIRSIERSPLLRRQVVTFVEGPTQQTLPRHEFKNRLQLALLDGPHGYPFPDLEYYFIYPHLDPGALLIVDDIHIPTITNLFDFLSEDAMFALQEIVENTAFFRRTDAPTFSPIGDGWETQRYNQRPFARTAAQPVFAAPPERSEQPVPFYVDEFGPISDPANAAAPLRIPRGQGLGLSGWALDPARQSPASAIDLVLDGVPYRAAVRVPRGDIAQLYGRRDYLRSGFNTELPAALMTTGPHELEVRVLISANQRYVPAVRFQFEVV
jgi:hypothetical protein